MTYLTAISRRRAPAVGADPAARTRCRTARAASPGRSTTGSRLRRFLILGSEGGTYYAGEWKLTRENAQAVERCLATDGPRAVAEIVAVSEGGRAPKNDPALFALAMAAGRGDEATRKAALEALPRVARTVDAPVPVRDVRRGLPRLGPLRSAARSAAGTPAARPSRSPTRRSKYRQREGMTHRDLLRLAHPAGRVGAGNPTLELTDEHRRLFEWIVRGGDTDGLPRIVEGFALAQAAETPARGGGARPRVRPAARGAPDAST